MAGKRSQHAGDHGRRKGNAGEQDHRLKIFLALRIAARALGKAASRAASSQGSKPSRVKPETTLSGIPFCSSPTAAKRKSFRSEWSSENRTGSAMIASGSGSSHMPSGGRL